MKFDKLINLIWSVPKRFIVNELGGDVNLSFTQSWKGAKPVTPLHHAIEMDFYWYSNIGFPI